MRASAICCVCIKNEDCAMQSVCLDSRSKLQHFLEAEARGKEPHERTTCCVLSAPSNHFIRFSSLLFTWRQYTSRLIDSDTDEVPDVATGSENRAEKVAKDWLVSASVSESSPSDHSTI